jgi:putative ABC transport system substrate-binding protein
MPCRKFSDDYLFGFVASLIEVEKLFGLNNQRESSMFRKSLFILLALLLTITMTSVMAQDDIPTVAIIKFGPLPPFELSQQGTLDQLAAYGYEDGENINILLYDSNVDVPTANTQIEDAIDQGADVIITITTPVTLAAINATSALAEPPVILFNTVTEPYAAGIAQAACLKPAHVWGSQALPDFGQILPLLFEVNPDIQTVGSIYSTSEPNAVASMALIEPLAEELGLELIVESVAETAEVGAAAESLADAGIEAFFIPTDSTVGNGLPAILAVAEEVGIPVFFADSAQVYSGVTVAAGLSYYQEGVDTGRVLIAYLNGEIDIATTGLSRQLGTRIAINLDSAAAQGVEIPQSLLDQASFVIEDGESTEAAPSLPDVTTEELQEMDQAFVEGLFCSPERIAEQEAALEAEGD